MKGFAILQAFSGRGLFLGLRIVSGGIFLIFQKCPCFWPLSVVTLSFSVIVTYVTL
jgi:hypothetical protein